MKKRRLQKIRENFGDNSMLMMSGIGFGFRGKNFKTEGDRAAGIELRTRWVIVLWLPLIPIGSYRIRRSTRLTPHGRTRRVLELFSKEPLAWRQVFRIVDRLRLLWDCVYDGFADNDWSSHKVNVGRMALLFTLFVCFHESLAELE